jgi:hypothetical protein
MAQVLPVFKVPNYKVYHIPHPDDRAHGGAAIIIRNSVSHYELLHHQNEKIQAAKVKVNIKPRLHMAENLVKLISAVSNSERFKGLKYKNTKVRIRKK